MSIYKNSIEMAKRLINKYGKTVSFKVTPFTINDPLQPWLKNSGTTVTYSVKMVFLTKYMEQLFIKYMIKTSIPTGDINGYMAQQSFVPKINDIIEDGSKTLIISEINKISPNGDDILYILRLKL